MKISIDHLDRLSETRPEYKEKLLAVGTVRDGMIEVPHLEYVRIATEHVETVSDQIYFRPEESLLPGDIFALIIRKFTGARMCQRCRARRDWMNKAGWWKCWKHRKLIMEWMYEEAKIRGFNLPADTAWALFTTAIKTMQKTKRERKKPQV